MTAAAPESTVVKLMCFIGTALFWPESYLILVAVMMFRSWSVGLDPDAVQRLVNLRSKHPLPFDYLSTYANEMPFDSQYARSPVGRYAHMLMAGAWTVLALTQVSTSLRMRCPRVH
jgi:hypothetical protein